MRFSAVFWNDKDLEVKTLDDIPKDRIIQRFNLRLERLDDFEKEWNKMGQEYYKLIKRKI